MLELSPLLVRWPSFTHFALPAAPPRVNVRVALFLNASVAVCVVYVFATSLLIEDAVWLMLDCMSERVG